MIPFVQDFASSSALASCQVSGTKTASLLAIKNTFWIVLPFWIASNKNRNVLNQNGSRVVQVWNILETFVSRGIVNRIVTAVPT